MLCTTEADTYSSETACNFSIMWSISIGTYLKMCVFAAQIHQSCKIIAEFCCLRRNFTFVNVAVCTIQRDIVTFFQNLAINFNDTFFIVNIYSTCTANATFTHTSSNHCCVARHTSTSCQDTFRLGHTCKIFRTSFKTNEDDFMSIMMPLFCIISKEYDLTTSCTRTCREATCKLFCLTQCFPIEYWV